MKKKHISVILLIVGLVLVCCSIALSVVATGNKNIIGGADFSTFIFVFFREKKGLYSMLAFGGIISLVVSAVFMLRKPKQ